METIAIFASGNGTNAESIVRYLQDHHSSIRVGLIATDNPQAGVIARASRLGVSVWCFERKDLRDPAIGLKTLQEHRIDYIILAGYLGLIPETLLSAYPSRILNIHPGLLPDFGGKGMYGDRVHQTVLDTHQTESGITIHLIDQEYDRGHTLCEVRLRVLPDDSVETLATHIHRLEHFYYPRVIEEYIGRQA